MFLLLSAISLIGPNMQTNLLHSTVLSLVCFSYKKNEPTIFFNKPAIAAMHGPHRFSIRLYAVIPGGASLVDQ